MRISLVLYVGLTLTSFANAQDLDIINIRVGQGDATLILGPESNGERVSVLVDAGGIPVMGRDGGSIVGAVLAKNGVTQLDHFVATHYDADHIGGVVTGQQNIHGRSFVLGLDQHVGEPGDDDGDGDTDWLDSSLTKVEPDPE